MCRGRWRCPELSWARRGCEASTSQTALSKSIPRPPSTRLSGFSPTTESSRQMALGLATCAGNRLDLGILANDSWHDDGQGGHKNNAVLAVITFDGRVLEAGGQLSNLCAIIQHHRLTVISRGQVVDCGGTIGIVVVFAADEMICRLCSSERRLLPSTLRRTSPPEGDSASSPTTSEQHSHAWYAEIAQRIS